MDKVSMVKCLAKKGFLCDYVLEKLASVTTSSNNVKLF